jgi:RND family efflux transporter MFP subunit
MNPPSTIHEQERKTAVRAVFTFLAALAILSLAIVGAILMVVNKRVAKQEDKPRSIPGVTVTLAETGPHPVKILTQGVIESRRESLISAEVTGRVLEISPNLKRGGIVRQGETLVTLDKADYLAALARAQAALADAELVLAQENARVEQARLDWEKLGRGASGNPLALREPQLAAAQAMAESARAELERTKRDVERTEITAPFDASIREANLEVGSIAAPGLTIARLFSISELEIRLPLTLEDFGFLQRSADGSITGTITLTGTIGSTPITWSAEPNRLDREIDRRTLSAHLVARILPGPDKNFPLPPVGLFVQAEIHGLTLDPVAEIPRQAIREGSQVIIVNPDDTIAFRDLEIIRSTRETAIVRSGLAPGERICLTRLNAPVAGMQVRITEAQE